ncbi:hypothetical protein L1887_10064 [Cichorium endivia]|nr:hypothetical protein L1887_10064 [Cichorium endivia]
MVCSSFVSRGNCGRAYLKPLEDEGGSKVYVMRFVLTYGLHHHTNSPDSGPFINKRSEEAMLLFNQHNGQLCLIHALSVLESTYR